MIGQYIVTEFKVNYCGVIRTFVGVFSEANLRDFIAIKIVEYAGDTVVETRFMSKLVTQVIEDGSMTWDSSRRNFVHLIIDDANPKVLDESCQYALDDTEGPGIKYYLQLMRDEENPPPPPQPKKKAKSSTKKKPD